MALTENGGSDMVMPVQPMYGGGQGGQGGFGFGGDWAWILLLLVLGGGWGGFGGFGMGGAMMGMGMMGMDYLYPWLNNSQNINDGFRDQQLSTQVSSIQSAIQSLASQLCECCGNMRYDMSQGFNGVDRSVAGAQAAIAQQMYANQIADMERSYAAQTATAQGFNGVQAGLADTKYTIATEECATRSAAAMNARDIIDSQNRGTQAILDKLCALELDGVKAQLAQAQRENVGLQNQVNMATMQASQVQQTSDIINGTYTRLSQCPVSSTPVYGNQPIFTCPQQVNSGCGCGGFAN